MPAARTKADLITICDRDFAKLAVLLDGLRESDARARDAEGWSIKDVIAHRTHWIHLTLGWAREGRAGGTPAIPAPGYKWNALKSYNLMLRDTYANDSWTTVREGFRAAHFELMREIDMLDEGALYGTPMPGADSPWPTGRFLEACGASHYRSAAKFVRAQIRLRKAAEAKAAKRAA